MEQPFFVFEITSRCNLNCIFCYNVWHHTENSYLNRKTELDINAIDKLMKKITSEVTPRGFAITGGEPLLYENLEEVIKNLKANVDLVNLVSNGLLLNHEKLDRLLNAGLTHLDISLISLNREKYKCLTGFDYMEKLKNILTGIKKYNPIFNISIMVCRLNFIEVNQLIDFAVACGADSITINLFTPTGRGIKNRDILSLNNKDIISLLNLTDHKAAELNIPLHFGIPIEPCVYSLKKYKNLKFSSCLCGLLKWVIDAQGNLRICEQSDVVLGNLFQHSFPSLSRSKEVIKFRNLNYKNNCIKCDDYKICRGGCRYRRRLESKRIQ